MRKDLYEGKTPIVPIPERRPAEKQKRAYAFAQGVVSSDTGKGQATKTEEKGEPSGLKKRLWYCKQCGYVVFREDPPYICPICKAKREMFTTIDISANG